jgi:hypothetical protein
MMIDPDEEEDGSIDEIDDEFVFGGPSSNGGKNTAITAGATGD